MPTTVLAGAGGADAQGNSLARVELDYTGGDVASTLRAINNAPLPFYTALRRLSNGSIVAEATVPSGQMIERTLPTQPALRIALTRDARGRITGPCELVTMYPAP